MSRVKLRFHSFCVVEKELDDGRLAVSYDKNHLVPADMEGIVAFERAWPISNKAKKRRLQLLHSPASGSPSCGKLSFYRSKTDEWYRVDDDWVKENFINDDEEVYSGMPHAFPPHASLMKSTKLSQAPRQYNMRAYHEIFEVDRTYILKKYKRPVLATMIQTVRITDEMVATALNDVYSV